MNWWRVAQTIFTVGMVGYAAYLWYDEWMELESEVNLNVNNSFTPASTTYGRCFCRDAGHHSSIDIL